MIVPVEPHDSRRADVTSTPARTAYAPREAATLPSWRGHLSIARVDRRFKNVFDFPGIVVALGTDRTIDLGQLGWRTLVGLLAVCLIASSNYTLNELIDAPFDRHHPTKRVRPVPSGQVKVWLGYVQWIVLMAAGIG